MFRKAGNILRLLRTAWVCWCVIDALVQRNMSRLSQLQCGYRRPFSRFFSIRDRDDNPRARIRERAWKPLARLHQVRDKFCPRAAEYVLIQWVRQGLSRT